MTPANYSLLAPFKINYYLSDPKTRFSRLVFAVDRTHAAEEFFDSEDYDAATICGIWSL